MLEKIKMWVVQQVLWAEKNLPDKTGAEKRDAVIAKLDELIQLPFYLEWVDGAFISWLIDLVCEKLNWIYDYDFSHAEPTPEQLSELAQAADVVNISDFKNFDNSKSIDERFNELCKQHKITPKDIDINEPTPHEQAIKLTPVAEENFQKSIDFSLKWEGGRNFTIVNGKPVIKGAAKNDLGGATAYGVIIPTLKAAYASGVVKHDDICKLTQDEAKEIYRKNFWERWGWGELKWPACLCALDCSINHSPKGFTLILQRAASDCGQNLAIDGKFGRLTFAALKACEPSELARAIVKRRKEYFEKIVANKPSQKVFLNGWMRRVNDMAKAAGV